MFAGGLQAVCEAVGWTATCGEETSQGTVHLAPTSSGLVCLVPVSSRAVCLVVQYLLRTETRTQPSPESEAGGYVSWHLKQCSVTKKITN